MFLPVIDDDGVGGGEVDPHPTRFGGENEQKRIRRGVAKTINARLPREPREVEGCESITLLKTCTCRLTVRCRGRRRRCAQKGT